MMGGFGGIGMVLWIGLIIVGIWWIAQAVTNQRASSLRAPEVQTPRNVLDERLARGEVTVEQHRELKKALE